VRRHRRWGLHQDRCEDAVDVSALTSSHKIIHPNRRMVDPVGVNLTTFQIEVINDAKFD
jgi:hypothetical protein